MPQNSTLAGATSYFDFSGFPDSREVDLDVWSLTPRLRAEDTLARWEHLLVELMRDRLELRRRHVREERQAGEDLRDFSHAPSLESLT